MKSFFKNYKTFLPYSARLHRDDQPSREQTTRYAF